MPMPANASKNSLLIDDFIANLFHEAGLSKLPKTFLDDYYFRLEMQIYRRLGVAFLEHVPKDRAEEFSALIGKDESIDPEEIFSFLQSSIPNFEDVLKTTLLSFKEEFLAILKQ